MDHSKFYVPPGGPPQITPSHEIYPRMGEENIFKMLEDFYLELEKSTIRHLFPEDMQEASKKSGAFFVFLCGGPPLYQQRFGPPMMRKRHMAFRIDEEARQVWLGCFQAILKDADKKYNFPMEHMDSFWDFLDQFSAWMVNTK
jgi:hemoglobin